MKLSPAAFLAKHGHACIVSGPRRPTPAFGVRLTLSVPPPLSALFNNVAGRGKVPSKRYTAWQRAVGGLVARMPSPPAYPCEVRAVIRAGKGWRKSADVANREKATIDQLVRSGVIPDDTAAYVGSIRFSFDAASPRLAGGSTITVSLAPVEVWW